jgi:3-dehydroquinate synthase
MKTKQSGIKTLYKQVNVRLGSRSYGIHIENGSLNRGGEWIKLATGSKRFLLLSTRPVFKTYGKPFLKSFKKIGARVHPLLVPDGESSKSKKTLFFILNKMASLGFQKDCCLVTLGGGVIGDLGGLAASLYMRGIDFIQCPTTLLAQVDASVGGKTAIDFAGIKNLIGAFYQPKLVLIDPSVLKTLSERQFKTGLAEIIKYGVIKDAGLFKRVENNLSNVLKRDPKILFSIISRSCAIKAEIVSADERESGKRAWLNYGHTLGHALESYFHYRVLTHGEAIAYGMWFASLLSSRLGICSEYFVQTQYLLLKNAGLFRKLPRFNPEKIYEKMFLDKKARNGRIQFVLTRKMGLVTIQKNIPRSIILSALTQLQAEASESS